MFQFRRTKPTVSVFHTHRKARRMAMDRVFPDASCGGEQSSEAKLISPLMRYPRPVSAHQSPSVSRGASPIREEEEELENTEQMVLT